jgi:DNA-binding transcriptional MerR regulator
MNASPPGWLCRESLKSASKRLLPELSRIYSFWLSAALRASGKDKSDFFLSARVSGALKKGLDPDAASVPIMPSEEGEGLYRVSEFAALTGVTVRALHHYDRLGLVRPTGRSAAGYRLYGARDFARLQQVVTLKFIGLSLKEIKALLAGPELDLAATLRLQREVLESRRRQLDLALRAVAEAEALAARDGGPDWEAFKKIVGVVTMQQDYEWVKKYYTEEQLADLARRGTPEVLEPGQRDWQALIGEVEQAVAEGADPAGERAQALAARWSALIEEFTGGDPGIRENLARLYADQANWPDTFRKPYSDEVGAFIQRAQAAGPKG